MAFEPNNLMPVGTNSTTGITIFYYHSLVDQAQAILADDYFDEVSSGLAVGDIMLIQGSNQTAVQAIATVDPVTLKGFAGIIADNIRAVVDSTLDAGGTPPQPDMDAVLRYLVRRLNLKIADGGNVGIGAQVLREVDRSDPTNAEFNFRSIRSNTLDISIVGDDILIDDPGTPGNLRSVAFNTGLRRLHVSKGGAAPLDGSTPDLSFSTIQAALNVMLAGDVITIGAGEYRERPSITGRSGTVAEPIWIAAEVPGTVVVSDAWFAAKDGTQSWTLENAGTGRYSAAHVDVWGGVHNGNFLPRYSSIAVLEASSVDGRTKPEQGLTFTGGRVHIILKSAANPNGQSILITETTGRDTIDFNNCDNIIVDGLEVEGAGNGTGIDFDNASANVTITNCRSQTARFAFKGASDLICTWSDYSYAGFSAWMRETVTLNGGLGAAFFDIVKGDLADGANPKYEGSLAIAGEFGDASTHFDALFEFNRCFGVFDGFRFGEWQDSECSSCLFVETGDDCVEFEDNRNANHGKNNRLFFCKAVNPHGPFTSHQNPVAAVHDTIRNVVQITEEAFFKPQFLIKSNQVAVGSNIRFAHNYFENFSTSGTRSPWYPFSTPANSGGDEIDHFVNNIVVFPGAISPSIPQAGGSPGNANGNALVNDTSEIDLQGAGGVFAGTAKADMDVNSDFTLQSGSPARGIGVSLPAGMVDPITDGTAQDDAGAHLFGADIGPDWPRPNALSFNLATLPSRWTSPGGVPSVGGPTFGGPFAPWAIPQAGLPTDPNSSAEVAEIYNAADRFNLNARNFCPARFKEEESTIQATVDIGDNGNSNIADGSSVPWNTAWAIPTDSDAQAIVIDTATGRCRTFSQASYNSGTNTLSCNIGTLVQEGVEATLGATADIFEKENATRVARACGIAYPLFLPTREELQVGLIPHCIPLLIPQPTQFAHVPPAIKGAGGTGGGPGRSAMGVRIVWDLTQSDIDNWLLTQAATNRPFLRAIANCLRDYGAMMADNGGNFANKIGAIWVEHNNSADWDALGFTSAAFQALHGLLQSRQSQARVLTPPVHIGGSDANIACYPGFNYPSGHPCNP